MDLTALSIANMKQRTMTFDPSPDEQINAEVCSLKCTSIVPDRAAEKSIGAREYYVGLPLAAAERAGFKKCSQFSYNLSHEYNKHIL